MNHAGAWLVGLIGEGDLPTLAPHRARAGWECAGADEGRLWLRLPVADEEVFARLPMLGRWTSDTGNTLTRLGRKVPDRRMPDSGWKPLAAWLGLLFPAKSAPGMSPFPIGFGLVDSDVFREAGALLARWGCFESWAEQVLSPRLGCLRFALDDAGRVLVTGDPLPAVDGTPYWKCGRLWLPAGKDLPDWVWPELVEEAFKLPEGCSALLDEAGGHSVIPDEAFVKASRTAVRVSGGKEVIP